MSDDEIKNKNIDLITYFVEKILDTVKKIRNQEQQPDTTDTTRTRIKNIDSPTNDY